MWWIVGVVVVLVLLPLWQIAVSLVPIGEHFKRRGAILEERAHEAEMERIRRSVEDESI